MTISYNASVPVATNNPSVDQPDMTINTQSVATIIAVDHVGFNSSGNPPPASNGIGGTHLQVTFNGKNTPGAQTDPQSVLYTASGSASSVSQLQYVNQNVTIPLTNICAWGIVTPSGLVSGQSANVVSAVRNTVNQYTITLKTNTVKGTNFGVLISVQTISNSPYVRYVIVSEGVFQCIFPNTSTEITSFTFQVMQA